MCSASGVSILHGLLERDRRVTFANLGCDVYPASDLHFTTRGPESTFCSFSRLQMRPFEGKRAQVALSCPKTRQQLVKQYGCSSRSIQIYDSDQITHNQRTMISFHSQMDLVNRKKNYRMLPTKTLMKFF